MEAPWGRLLVRGLVKRAEREGGRLSDSSIRTPGIPNDIATDRQADAETDMQRPHLGD